MLTSPLTRPPAWLRPLFPGSEWRGQPLGPAGRPRLYLTFDDGPHPDETPWVLEQLAAYQAQATFFCVGDNLRRHPQVARAALLAGHRLGNHTQHHQNAWRTSRATYLAGVAECEELVVSCQLSVVSQVPSAANPLATDRYQLPTDHLFRPPYGRLTWPMLRALRAGGHRVVMWSLLTRDYDPALPPERALRLTLAAVRPGDIVVLHDSRKAAPSLRYQLPRLLAHCAERGYEFATL